MTPLDVGVGVAVLALAALGWERGLIRSGLPLVGFVIGAALGARLGPELLSGGSESAYAPVVTLLSGVLLGAMLGVALEGVGRVVHERLARRGALAAVDGFGGALLLGALGLLVAWALAAVALHTPGFGAGDVRGAVQRSAILGALNDAFPPSGPLLHMLRRVAPTPVLPGPDARVGAPSEGAIDEPAIDRAGDSTVRVLGSACGLGVAGSGWVVAPQLVVTNAHVVAGEDDTTVTSRSGAPELDAVAVHYDPANDLALLAVRDLDLEPLPLVSDPRRGREGATLGYPNNGPFTIAPARLGATRTVVSEDSYGRGPVERRMTAFRGRVRSGDSGGPLVDRRGRVLTTVFAARRGAGPPGGLGVPNRIVARSLRDDLRPTGTGPCTA